MFPFGFCVIALLIRGNYPSEVETMEADEKHEHMATEIYESIPEEDVCIHTPDNYTDHINLEERGNTVISDYRCKCGKLVREIYTYSNTVVL